MYFIGDRVVKIGRIQVENEVQRVFFSGIVPRPRRASTYEGEQEQARKKDRVTGRDVYVCGHTPHGSLMCGAAERLFRGVHQNP